MKRLFTNILLILSATVMIWSCKKEDTNEEDALRQAVVDNYANIVLASYEDCYGASLVMQQKIKEFVEAPSETRLQAAKDAWLFLRLIYGQTEAYRFYAGPIDNDNGPEGLLNAWPIDENYIDYVTGNAESGIINRPDLYPTITALLLESLNEDGSETNISTGFHAIEFLLWGQDFSTDGPGSRPYTDYVTDGSGTASNQARRAQYLSICADMIVSQLDNLVDQWQPSATYRTSFENSASLNTSLGNMISAISILSKGELAGERMTVALETKSQEDEHSCFSDNTHNDIKMNFRGIKNVYLGKYVRADGRIIEGKGFHDLVNSINSTGAAEILAALNDADAKVVLVDSPFDQNIITDPGNHILNAINALRVLGDELAEAANIAKVPLIE
jgi:putative iron-regulated protein